MLSLLKGLLGTILFFVVFFLIVLAILFHNTIRNMKIFRSNAEKAAEKAARKAAAEEEYFRRTSTKNYRDDKPKFKDDYFKSTTNKQETQGQYTRQGQRVQEQNTARKTTTGDGVTIIDQRQEAPGTDRKIFDDNEGEYVEFEEV